MALKVVDEYIEERSDILGQVKVNSDAFNDELIQLQTFLEYKLFTQRDFSYSLDKLFFHYSKLRFKMNMKDRESVKKNSSFLFSHYKNFDDDIYTFLIRFSDFEDH